MAVNPVSDNQAWMQFISAAKAARARNPVLDAARPKAAAELPLPAARRYPAQTSAAGGLAAATGSDRASAPKRVLGGLFDAYA